MAGFIKIGDDLTAEADELVAGLERLRRERTPTPQPAAQPDEASLMKVLAGKIADILLDGGALSPRDFAGFLMPEIRPILDANEALLRDLARVETERDVQALGRKAALEEWTDYGNRMRKMIDVAEARAEAASALAARVPALEAALEDAIGTLQAFRDLETVQIKGERMSLCIKSLRAVLSSSEGKPDAERE